MPPRMKGAPDLLDEDISFPLARLFDKFNLDHIPPRKRMDEFEHRDLAHIKHYKAAVKIFGGPLSRKRVMVAPPMELPVKHRLGLYVGRKSPPPPTTLNCELKPQAPAVKPEPEELVLAREAREREDKYKAWFKERQKFRNDLENMGLNSQWLANKPNKTLLEKRVLHQLKNAEGKGEEIEEVISETPDTVTHDYTSESELSLPQLLVPAPLGLQILDQHLKEKKLRLLDLFTDADKNKDWRLSREEFVKQCNERNIPLSKALLEDMLISLDMNLDEELDYKELSRGMELARREKREDKRKELSRESTSLSQKSGTPNGKNSQNGSAMHVVPEVTINNSQLSSSTKKSGSSKLSDKPKDPNLSKETENTKDSTKKTDDTGSSLKSRRTIEKGDLTEKSSSKSVSKVSDPKNQSILSSVSNGSKSESNKGAKVDLNKASKSERTSSPSYLEPPLVDTKPDRLVLPTEEEMVDLRKHDREALKGYNAKIEGIPPTILTGTKAIDDHCMQSTLVGEVGEMVNKFRQKRLQEYFEVTKLCQQNDIVLTRTLLERVLLYPPDKPHAAMHKLRHPDSAPLVSAHFADPPKRPRTPIEVKHKDKVRRSKSGKLLIDSRHKYPANKNVSADAYKQNLSTGRAVIRRKVDCWMTFEEYERLTRNLAVRYQHLHGTSKTNAFWPGQLVDKIRLCMPPYDKPSVRDKESAIYRRVQRKPAVNYGYEPVDVWQTNDSMYTQIGIHDHFRNKTII